MTRPPTASPAGKHAEPAEPVKVPPTSAAKASPGSGAAPLLFTVDDDASLLRVMEHHLVTEGYRVEKFRRPEEALAKLESSKPALVLTDLRMPGMNGVELVREVRRRLPDAFVIVLTGFPSVESAVEAMREGAFDFIQKPVQRDPLLRSVAKALELRRLAEENRRLRHWVDGYLSFEGLVAQAPSMQRLLAQARQVASSQAPILLLGETGSGKEVLARALHHASPRGDGPFIAINCAAIPADLLESELFGHAKGAFTGAVTDKTGRIQAAEGGTLFLDEIGDLPLALQPKLLRVLQERTVEPVGKNQGTPVDFRLICATHRDLAARVAQGQFREDLFYRLNVVPLKLPPLRERRADIPALFLRLCHKACELEGRPSMDVEPALLEKLAQRDWPGNVRELENAAKRLVALCPDSVLRVEALKYAGLDDDGEGSGAGATEGSPRAKRTGATPLPPGSELPEGHLDLEAWTDDLILRALAKHGGNQSATARYLGVSRNTLVYRMEKRGLRG